MWLSQLLSDLFKSPKQEPPHSSYSYGRWFEWMPTHQLVFLPLFMTISSQRNRERITRLMNTLKHTRKILQKYRCTPPLFYSSPSHALIAISQTQTTAPFSLPRTLRFICIPLLIGWLPSTNIRLKLFPSNICSPLHLIIVTFQIAIKCSLPTASWTSTASYIIPKCLSVYSILLLQYLKSPSFRIKSPFVLVPNIVRSNSVKYRVSMLSISSTEKTKRPSPVFLLWEDTIMYSFSLLCHLLEIPLLYFLIHFVLFTNTTPKHTL